MPASFLPPCCGHVVEVHVGRWVWLGAHWADEVRVVVVIEPVLPSSNLSPGVRGQWPDGINKGMAKMSHYKCSGSYFVMHLGGPLNGWVSPFLSLLLPIVVIVVVLCPATRLLGSG